MSDHNWNFLADLNEAAWGIIANAWEGDWSKAPAEWREAAERWRDAYHETLPRGRQPWLRGILVAALLIAAGLAVAGVILNGGVWR